MVTYRRVRVEACLILALLACLFVAPLRAAEKIQSDKQEVLLDKAPDWALPRIEPAARPSAETRGVTSWPLVDRQIDWRGKESAYFSRFMIRVTNNESLKVAGEIVIGFDPAYEKLILHELVIHRDGARLDRLDKKIVRVVQDERDLQTNRMMTGRANAIIVVPDLRLGDLLEYAYTLQGDNPVFGSKRSTVLMHGYGVDVETLRTRVLFPAQRPLHVKSLLANDEFKKTPRGAYDEYLLVKSNVRAVMPDAMLARWYNPWPRMQLTEYSTWSEVEAWGETLFPSGAASPAVLSLADGFRRETASDEEAAGRALRFVQEEIRYLAMAIGENAFRAAEPGVVLERRYGDCKDKVNLLIALLRRMNIEAWPALVSAQTQHRVAEFMPGPMFDHAIAVVRIQGREYWVDPTESQQAAVLERMRAGRFGYALFLKPGSAALTAQPDSVLPLNELSTNETIVVKDFKQPARMTLEILASGQEASDLRRAVLAGMMDRYVTSWKSAVERPYPNAKLVGAFSIDDDLKNDRFRFRQEFELPDMFEFDKRELYARMHSVGVGDYLQIIAMSNRDWPASLGRAGVYRHNVRIELPEPVAPTTPVTFNDADNFLSYAQSLTLTGKVADAKWTVVVKREYVPGADLASHMARRNHWREQYSAGIRVTPLGVQDFAKQVRAVMDRRFDALTRGKLNDTALAEMRTLRFDAEAQELRYFLDRVAFGTKQRARLLVDYGILLDNQGKRKEALQTMNDALTLDADSTYALVSRGESLIASRRLNDALDDFRRAEALGVDASRLGMKRGVARYYMGDYAGAAGDFKTAALGKSGSDRLFALLWLYLAASRSGGNGAVAIKDFAIADDNKPTWPAPLLQFLTGALDENGLQGQTKANDPLIELERRCEMLFYMGQYAALKGDTGKARNHFEAARATGAVWMGEQIYAGLEVDGVNKAR